MAAETQQSVLMLSAEEAEAFAAQLREIPSVEAAVSFDLRNLAHVVTFTGEPSPDVVMEAWEKSIDPQLGDRVF